MGFNWGFFNTDLVNKKIPLFLSVVEINASVYLQSINKEVFVFMERVVLS
jgi:hypothetical protein